MFLKRQTIGRNDFLQRKLDKNQSFCWKGLCKGINFNSNQCEINLWLFQTEFLSVHESFHRKTLTSKSFGNSCISAIFAQKLKISNPCTVLSKTSGNLKNTLFSLNLRNNFLLILRIHTYKKNFTCGDIEDISKRTLQCIKHQVPSFNSSCADGVICVWVEYCCAVVKKVKKR